ncbi:MAG: A/G-specific adenine glycosylase [Methylotenera sp.]|uniref:A/G-specific adenine glycosylase n=1 Tax=Methylotenera sp. TaxID=2051956 RepID=UPI000D4924E1|nr:A/G-specific adenine glycosylase [Methylotenera sp.]PPC81217.1 MAG: A/G-specific adenine glycosylase [Methylotenera sp.]
MTDFANRLISWQKIHGRHDLPWQNTTDPYAIWVSEIMLQQTQVSAVIGYYAKFMARFPTIADLANATQDEVLQHWSGLGYYSRARNLHHAAQTMMDEHAGQFPQDFNTIQTLSGIGRSTAAAIASFAFNQVQTILDGNVKRVLARHFAISGWTSAPKTEKTLWQLAESLLPQSDMVAYTQGLMDLGATICTRSKPKCTACPLVSTCMAYQQQLTTVLPTPKPKKSIPEKSTTMLILRQGNEVMLVKRPATGIWGGLWSFPEIDDHEQQDYVALALSQFGINTTVDAPLATISHVFTHFKLHIKPQLLTVNKHALQAREANAVWLDIEDALGAAIPTPVRNILLQLKHGA